MESCLNRLTITNNAIGELRAKNVLAAALQKLEHDEVWDTDCHTNAYNLLVELELQGFIITNNNAVIKSVKVIG